MNIPKIESIRSLARGDDNISFIKVLNLLIYHSAAHRNSNISYSVSNDQYENAIMQNYLHQLYNSGYSVKSFDLGDYIMIVIRWDRPAELRLNLPNGEYEELDDE